MSIHQSPKVSQTSIEMSADTQSVSVHVEQKQQEIVNNSKMKTLQYNQCLSLLKNGVGVEPKETIESGDFHIWLEDDDGKIIDPTPPPYSFFPKLEYKKWSMSNQKKVWSKYQQIIKNMTKTQRISMKKNLYKNPQIRQCPYNVYAYWCYHKHLKIVVGSCGYYIDNNTIFWEFG